MEDGTIHSHLMVAELLAPSAHPPVVRTMASEDATSSLPGDPTISLVAHKSTLFFRKWKGEKMGF